MLLFPVGVAFVPHPRHLFFCPCLADVLAGKHPAQPEASPPSQPRTRAGPSWEHLPSSSPRTSPSWLGVYHLMELVRVPGEETQLLEFHSASQQVTKKRELAGWISLDIQKPLGRLFHEVK